MHLKKKQIDKICSLEEIKSIIGINDITWEDVKEAIKGNKSIDESFISYILEGIDNLEKSGINYDLTALYLNLKTMTVEKQDINDNYNEGEYKPFSNKVSIDQGYFIFNQKKLSR